MYSFNCSSDTSTNEWCGGGELTRAPSCFQYSVASILGKLQWDLGRTALPDLGFIMVCKEPPLLVRIEPQGKDARESRTLGLKDTP